MYYIYCYCSIYLSYYLDGRRNLHTTFVLIRELMIKKPTKARERERGKLFVFLQKIISSHKNKLPPALSYLFVIISFARTRDEDSEEENSPFVRTSRRCFVSLETRSSHWESRAVGDEDSARRRREEVVFR